jgi:hypothetical protein
MKPSRQLRLEETAEEGPTASARMADLPAGSTRLPSVSLDSPCALYETYKGITKIVGKS